MFCVKDDFITIITNTKIIKNCYNRVQKRMSNYNKRFQIYKYVLKIKNDFCK